VTAKHAAAMRSNASTVVARRPRLAPSKANIVTIKHAAATRSNASTVVAKRPRLAPRKATLVALKSAAAQISYVVLPVSAKLRYRREGLECIEEPCQE
jgi:hypothetical protein